MCCTSWAVDMAQARSFRPGNALSATKVVFATPRGNAGIEAVAQLGD